MKAIDCVWEKENLGEKTVEIVISHDDVYNIHEIQNITNNYEYIVIKVPMNMLEFNFGLTQLGFTCIETQMNISKRYKDFPFEDRLVRQIYPKVYSKKVETRKELDEIIEKMTPNMFSTDRIYLDPHFPKGQSCLRYQNWLRNEFESGSTNITKNYFDGINVGFGMGKRDYNGTEHGLLGGIFEEYQNEGLGLMTTSIGFINAHKENNPFKVMRTSISSNNIPVMQFYNYLNYKIDSMNYVFVKHVSSQQ